MLALEPDVKHALNVIIDAIKVGTARAALAPLHRNAPLPPLRLTPPPLLQAKRDREEGKESQGSGHSKNAKRRQNLAKREKEAKEALEKAARIQSGITPARVRRVRVRESSLAQACPAS